MNTGPLNENELEWLDETLAKYATEGAILDVSELDGLLTAILSAPTDIEPAQWLVAIWGGADNVPRWANDRERDRFVDLTLQHMSDIAGTPGVLSRSVRTAVWHPRSGRSGADDRRRVVLWLPARRSAERLVDAAR